MLTSQRMKKRCAITALAATASATVLFGAAPAFATPSVDDCQPPGVSGAYPPQSATIGLSRTVVTQGSQDHVTAAGFAKKGQTGHDQTVSLTLCSTPTSLGTASINDDGTISKIVNIPHSAELGGHVIQAVGPNGRGGTTIVSTDLTVVAPTASTSGNLPFTGFDVVPIVLAAIALVATGGGLVLVTRRRLQTRVSA